MHVVVLIEIECFSAKDAKDAEFSYSRAGVRSLSSKKAFPFSKTLNEKLL